MQLDIKKITGHKLVATNGDIGHVKDFYFDDTTWAVRYIVADTGNWLPGRLVLLAPYAFGRFDLAEKVLPVDLTKNQIENSPSIDEHRPVSRQFEENYYGYYGWPTYWDGGGRWGSSDYPISLRSSPSELIRTWEYNRWDDVHLRSAKAVTGYRTDGTVGTVRSFVVDDKTWAIRELVAEAGHWYSGKEVMIAPEKITRISYETSTVFVSLSKSDIQNTVDHGVAMAGAGR
jgi:hypothetical protein